MLKFVYFVGLTLVVIRLIWRQLIAKLDRVICVNFMDIINPFKPHSKMFYAKKPNQRICLRLHYRIFPDWQEKQLLNLTFLSELHIPRKKPQIFIDLLEYQYDASIVN